jgi:hypothetical protein
MQRLNVFVAHTVRVKKMMPEGGLRKLIKPVCMSVLGGGQG